MILTSVPIAKVQNLANLKLYWAWPTFYYFFLSFTTHFLQCLVLFPFEFTHEGFQYGGKWSVDLVPYCLGIQVWPNRELWGQKVFSQSFVEYKRCILMRDECKTTRKQHSQNCPCSGIDDIKIVFVLSAPALAKSTLIYFCWHFDWNDVKLYVLTKKCPICTISGSMDLAFDKLL